MSRSDREAPLTVAELVRQGPVPGIRMFGATGQDNPVLTVRIVDRLELLNALRPREAVVLTGAAAHAGWSVDVALRKAWEHAASCVVAPDAPAHAGSAGALADRLGIPLLLIGGEPLEAAVQIAAAVASPGAGRTALVARAALALSDPAIRSADRVLGVLHDLLPGMSVAFVDSVGTLSAGRARAAGRPSEAAVPVTGPDGLPLGTLLASGRRDAGARTETVEQVLRLAVPAITAWAATERLADELSTGRSATLLRRLLDAADAGDTELAARMAAAGWPARGPMMAFALRIVGPAGRAPAPDPGAALRSAWARRRAAGPLVPYRDNWVAWQTVAPDAADVPAEAQRAAETLIRRTVRDLNDVVPAVGGIAGPVPGPDRLGRVLEDACAAASVAASSGAGTVVRADRMGAAHLLAAVPADALRNPAEVILAPLLAADRDGALLRTLAALLDAGSAPSVAAERLDVHRNTVAARLERIRSLGVDPDDPGQRLALHLACRVLLDTRSEGHGPGALPEEGRS